MIQAAQSFSKKLSNNDDSIPSKLLAKKGPVMITYNMHQNNDTQKNQNAWKNNANDIIQPEYSPIDWQAKMDSIRKETIEVCKKHTESIVKTAIDHQNRTMKHEIQKLREEKENMSEMITAIFHALQPVITKKVPLQLLMEPISPTQITPTKPIAKDHPMTSPNLSPMKRTGDDPPIPKSKKSFDANNHELHHLKRNDTMSRMYKTKSQLILGDFFRKLTITNSILMLSTKQNKTTHYHETTIQHTIKQPPQTKLLKKHHVDTTHRTLEHMVQR